MSLERISLRRSGRCPGRWWHAASRSVTSDHRREDCQIGPDVQLLTPTRPTDPQQRRDKLQAALPISIGNNADRDPEVAEAARCAYRRLEDDYAGCIEQAQTAGEVDATLDARALATYFVAVTRGMEVLGTAGADRSVLLSVGRAAFTLLT